MSVAKTKDSVKGRNAFYAVLYLFYRKELVTLKHENVFL